MILLELKKELSLILLKEISNLLFVFKGYEFIKKIFIQFYFFFNFKFYLQKNWSNLIFVIYLFIFFKKIIFTILI